MYSNAMESCKMRRKVRKKSKRLNENTEKDRKCFQELREAEIERWLLKRHKGLAGEFSTDEKQKLKSGFFDRLKRKKSLEEENQVVDEVKTKDLSGPLLSLGMAKNQRDLEDILKRVDLEGTGRISFDDFLRILHSKKKSKKLSKNAIISLQRNQQNSHLTVESLLSIKRRQHLLKCIMPRKRNRNEVSVSKLSRKCNEQRHQDLNFIKSISSVVADEIDKYPEWNITRSFECENRISPVTNNSKLETSLTLFDAQKFRVPSRKTIERLEADANDLIEGGRFNNSIRDKNHQDRLKMNKNRYYAYGF